MLAADETANSKASDQTITLVCSTNGSSMEIQQMRLHGT